MTYSARIKNFFYIVVTLLLTACASTETKLAVPYVVDFKAAKDVNKSMGMPASPIKLIVFELKSKTAFELADFFSLQKNPQEILGDQLLEIHSVILQPNSTASIKGDGNVQAKALGVIAAYRDIDNSQWRLLLDLPEAQSTNFYKFWQFSPDEISIQIDVNKAALQINRKQN